MASNPPCDRPVLQRTGSIGFDRREPSYLGYVWDRIACWESQAFGRSVGLWQAMFDRTPIGSARSAIHPDLHATILRLMGLDHNLMTYFYGGLDHKLTGVQEANYIREVIA